MDIIEFEEQNFQELCELFILRHKEEWDEYVIQAATEKGITD